MQSSSIITFFFSLVKRWHYLKTFSSYLFSYNVTLVYIPLPSAYQTVVPTTVPGPSSKHIGKLPLICS